MIDFELHAHAFMDGIDYKACKLIHEGTPNEKAVREVLSSYKENGITYVRDGGDNHGVSLLARSLSPSYGIDYVTPAFAIHKAGNYGSVVGKAFHTMAEYKALVQLAKEQNADFIKIMLSGILDFDHYGVVSPDDYTQDEVTEMVGIAHEEGFCVMAHVNKAENIRMAIKGGVDSIEHGYYMDEETIRLLSLTQIVWVPTLVTSKNLLRSDRNDKKEVEKILKTHEQNIKKAYALGALIGLGSDAGAYGVLHGRGTIDEYAALSSAVNDPKLDKMLRFTAQLIKKNFRAR